MLHDRPGVRERWQRFEYNGPGIRIKYVPGIRRPSTYQPGAAGVIASISSDVFACDKVDTISPMIWRPQRQGCRFLNKLFLTVTGYIWGNKER